MRISLFDHGARYKIWPHGLSAADRGRLTVTCVCAGGDECPKAEVIGSEEYSAAQRQGSNGRRSELRTSIRPLAGQPSQRVNRRFFGP